MIKEKKFWEKQSYCRRFEPSTLVIILKKTYIALRMQFDEIFFALETELSNFGPGKCVDFGEVLEDKCSHVSYGQI